MSKTIRSMALAGLLAAGGLLLAGTSNAEAQWGWGGQAVTIGRPGGFNVTIGSGYPGYYGYGYGGYPGSYGYGSYYGYAPGGVTYSRGYAGYYTAPTWGGGYYYPSTGVTTYRLAPGVRYSTYGYPSYGYYNYGYGYAPRGYYRTW